MLRNRIYRKTALVLFNLVFHCPIANAMVGSDQLQKHVDLAQTIEAHEAVGRVLDNELNFLQTGVLIKPNVVMTAGHGMQLLIDSNKYSIKDIGPYLVITPKKMAVTFTLKPGAEVTYTVECVVLDSRYIRFNPGEQHKFDFAFLKLSQKVENIQPINLTDKVNLAPDVPMVVITWGNADIPKKTLKRAFYLFEWSLFYPFLDEDALQPLRKVMISSMFFKPANKLPAQTSINDKENIQRRYYALKSWLSNGKKPYGLALPGTSGAPVLTVNKNGSMELFGIVMGYANLGEKSLTSTKELEKFAANPENAYDLFQTIIATPYRLNTDPSANTTTSKSFLIDKKYLEIIESLASGKIS
jgi:hypothetical protein